MGMLSLQAKHAVQHGMAVHPRLALMYMQRCMFGNDCRLIGFH